MINNHIVNCILIFLFTLLIYQVNATMCYTNFEQDTSKADIIFVGQLIDKNEDVFWAFNSPKNILTFKVFESYKGLHEYIKILSIIEKPYSINCKIDSTYLIFAYNFGGNSNIYWTNDCSLSGLLNDNIDNYNRLSNPIYHSDKELNFEYNAHRLIYNEYNFFCHKKYIKDSLDYNNKIEISNYKELCAKYHYLVIMLIVLVIALILFIYYKCVKS